MKIPNYKTETPKQRVLRKELRWWRKLKINRSDKDLPFWKAEKQTVICNVRLLGMKGATTCTVRPFVRFQGIMKHIADCHPNYVASAKKLIKERNDLEKSWWY